MILNYHFRRNSSKSLINICWGFGVISASDTKDISHYSKNDQVGVTSYLDEPPYKRTDGSLRPHMEGWSVTVIATSIEEGFKKAISYLRAGIQIGEKCFCEDVDPVPFPDNPIYVPGDYGE